MQNHQTNLFVTISLLGHLFILAGFVFCLDYATPSMQIGEIELERVSAYIYKGQISPLVSTKIQQPEHATPKKNIQSKLGLQKAMTLTDKKLIENTISKREIEASQPSSSRGEAADALLALLHGAIQNQQHYPPSAMQLERQGRINA